MQTIPAHQIRLQHVIKLLLNQDNPTMANHSNYTTNCSQLNYCTKLNSVSCIIYIKYKTCNYYKTKLHNLLLSQQLVQ